MHDPKTVAFDIKVPIGKSEGGFPRYLYIATIWHVDPEKSGDEDSCRWFVMGRPWWKHPRFHLRHLQVQIHFVQNLKRWLFTRCAGCGKRFPWGYAPVSHSWNGHGPAWFKGEENTYHHNCRS